MSQLVQILLQVQICPCMQFLYNYINFDLYFVQKLSSLVQVFKSWYNHANFATNMQIWECGVLWDTFWKNDYVFCKQLRITHCVTFLKLDSSRFLNISTLNFIYLWVKTTLRLKLSWNLIVEFLQSLRQVEKMIISFSRQLRIAHCLICLKLDS